MNERPDSELRTIMATWQGRQVIWHLLGLCGIHHNPFTGDPLSTAFAAGELNVGQKLQGWLLEAAPHSIADMYKEKANEQYPEQPRAEPNSSAPAGGLGDEDPARAALVGLDGGDDDGDELRGKFPTPGAAGTDREL